MAQVAFFQGNFDDASGHIECAKLYAIYYTYLLGQAMQLQASTWYRQRRIEEAKVEALGAAEVLERLGASRALEDCRVLLGQIELVAVAPESDDSGEILRTVGIPTHTTC